MGNLVLFKFRALPSIEYPARWKNKAKHVGDYKLLKISLDFPLHYFLESAQIQMLKRFWFGKCALGSVERFENSCMSCIELCRVA